MFCCVTFEYEFSDFIGTSYIKKHHVGDIKSILFGVLLFARLLFFLKTPWGEVNIFGVWKTGWAGGDII